MNPSLTISSLRLGKPGQVGYSYGVAMCSVGIPDDMVYAQDLNMAEIQVDEIAITIPSRNGQHLQIKFTPNQKIPMQPGETADSFPVGFQGAAPSKW